jgi:hypothetical protein
LVNADADPTLTLKLSPEDEVHRIKAIVVGAPVTIIPSGSIASGWNADC